MPAPNRFALTHNTLGCAAFAAEFVAILLTATITGVAYHRAIDGYPGSLQTYLSVGSIAAPVYCVVFLLRDGYDVESFFDERRTPGRLFLAWNLVFVAVAAIGFLPRETQISSCWLVFFYFTGAVAVLGLNAAIVRSLRFLVSRGLVRARRLMLVATETDFASLQHEIAIIAGRVTIERADTDPGEIERVLDAAIANARATGIENVFISDAFSRFKHARGLRFLTALSLTHLPLRLLESTTKRRFDIAVSALALVLLGPLFAIIALLIKSDSQGAAFLKQSRSAHSTNEFRPWMFRIMEALQDGATVRQVTRGGTRVTSIGALLRHLSLDKLLQLIKVFKGELPLARGCLPIAVREVGNHPLAFDLYILILT